MNQLKAIKTTSAQKESSKVEDKKEENKEEKKEEGKDDLSKFVDAKIDIDKEN